MNRLAFATLNHSPVLGPHPDVVALVDQVRAASAAGFDALSPDVFSLQAFRAAGGSWSELGDLLAASGMTCSDIAGLTVGADVDGTRREADDLLGIANALGAELLQARIIPVVDDAVRDLVAWCAAACTAAGVDLGVEFSSFTEVRSITAARELLAPLVPDAGVGIVLDTWHYLRVAPGWTELDALPVDELALVQLADGAPAGSDTAGDDPLHGRRLPGEGSLDLDGVATRLRAKGYGGVVSVEVLSDSDRNLGVGEFARRAYRSARAWLSS